MVELNASKWAAADNYNLDAFEQIDGPWPIGHPLPLPKWTNQSKKRLVIEKIWQYEDLCGIIEVTLHRILEETHYNTANNFVDFHKAFKQSKQTDLRQFYQTYVPPINRRHHTCASLAMEIVSRLGDVAPNLAEHCYLVSCEEAVEAASPYIENCEENGMENTVYSLEKEHVLIALKINVAGRDGLMILDAGYHVSRAVTVMKDQSYPHTGWFTQSNEPHCKREYCYTISSVSNDFVEWSERATRGNTESYELSLVYVERPYRSAVDVTVRRNLVYNFRSLLSRDAKGRVCAGLYFPVSNGGGDAQLTLFYDGPNDSSVKVKQKFSTFKDEAKIPDAIMVHLELLAPQLAMAMNDLLSLLKSLYEVICDQNFIGQVLSINDEITVMSADN